MAFQVEFWYTQTNLECFDIFVKILWSDRITASLHLIPVPLNNVVVLDVYLLIYSISLMPSYVSCYLMYRSV